MFYGNALGLSQVGVEINFRKSMSGVRAIIGFFLAAIFLLPNLNRAAGVTTSTNSASPLQITIGQTLRPEEEHRMVEAEGIVTFVGKQGRATYFEISSEAGYMPVTVAHGAGYLTDLLLKSRVRVRGVCTTAHSSVDGEMVGSLSATNMNDITILQLPEEMWRQFPLRTIIALTRTNVNVIGQIAHLRGKVQSVEPGRSFLLADETGQTVVESRQAIPEMLGMDVEALCGWHLRGSNRVFQCGVFRPQTETTNRASLPTLTTTEQIRWLKPDEAKQQYPVKVRGVITFLMMRRGANVGGDLQDGTGGIFLWEMWNVNSTMTNSGLKTGDFCEMDGVTSAGDFSPIVLCRKLTILGEGQFPEPAHPNWDALIDGGFDAQWVELQGIVLSATNSDMEIGMKDGRIACSLRGRGAESYLGDVVRVRGAVYAYHDNDRHITNVLINIPSQQFVSVEKPALENPFSIPVTHVSNLFTYNPNESAFRQVKVAGQIVHVRDGVYFAMDGTNGMRLVPMDGIKFGIGDMVEAVGFPNIDSPFDEPLLTLRDAVVRKTGQMPLPEAMKIAPGDFLNREHDSTLVQVESRLLDVSPYRAEQVLELQNGATIYRARLDAASGQIPQLQVGSLLAVTGVYAISSDKSVPFELLLNSPADIRVLELPSWWTVQHALFVVTSMALVIVLFLIWNGVLRQQVGRRTVELSTANQSLKNEITERKRAENELVQTRLQHLVEKERTRIARDLHDDLGSRVTRVVLLLDELALQSNLPMAEAPEHPAGISAAAREIIQSLDETVWAVNPHNDTLPHLFNYLSDFAVKFLKAANVRCRLDFPIHPPERVVSTEERHNLFLTVKETLNNAVRHAQATEVWLRATVNEESLILTVEDDGCGFESVAAHPSADGLKNMRQRMEEIGGQFDIASKPKIGTRVTLTFFWSPQK
jgi:signal transduction histidine kinase